VRGPGGKGDF
jgi:hypothetical protein